MKRINKKEVETNLQKALTIAYLEDYCKKNKLSVEKLKNEIFQLSYDQCGFFHPCNNTEVNGLLDDMETLPKATLVIRYKDEKLFIEQTEYTKEFLSAES